tara:strand:- start:545 stop:1009 length:465 start_codon:yes stop_codon:yes gene_type:complete
MEQEQIVPPTIRPAKWQQLLQKLYSESVKSEVPEELTIFGEFRALLRQFCTSRIRAMHPEEMLQGKPWTDNQGYTSFTIAGLMEFLNNRRFTAYTRAQVQEQLKRLNDNHECHGHKGITKEDGSRTTVRVWWVPSFESSEVSLPVQEIDNDIPF